MQNEIDLSENNLLGRRAIAKIVAPFEPVILPPSPCEDAWHVRKADGTAVIRCYGLENNGNDAIARMLAAHIATNSPEVFIAYTDEILRLRNELAAMKCRVCEGNIPAMRTCEELLNLSDRIETYNREFMRLESAAHWLVHNVREGCPPLPPEYLPDCDNEEHPHNCASGWVEAARKITDGEFQK